MRKLSIFVALGVNLLLASLISYGQTLQFPFQDPKLSFQQRVDDLVGRLTLEEKVAQLLNSAPAIDRLNIPAYDWWNETLHGVARTPYKVTVFPQAIAMAATFNTDALFKMADYSALEGRAIYNKALTTNKLGKRYQGLTYWTPNINIFRDPRWGRGQETYGEDPFLTATLGDAFVRGLQGDDPKYLKAAACAKHYAVHSGPEPLRHHFDVDVSAYDLWDTYLPAFKKLVVDSKVAGVMCAYNAFRTQPCCASDVLMNDILRKQWGFKGYVTSDCAGIEDFFTKHKTHPDAESASVDAVMHGTDVECGKGAYLSLVQAVKNNKIAESQIDISVKRLFMIRFQLGLFDPVDMVKYAQTPFSVLESQPHKDHALLMARQSMVLLKNDHVLPLKKQLKKIVVLGPNADNPVSILGNYNGNPSKLSTVLQGLKDKLGSNTEVVYEQAITYTSNELLNYESVKGRLSFEGRKGYQALYYNNVNLAGEPIAKRNEDHINHMWQEGENVIKNLIANDFSARFQTAFKAEADQSLSLELEADNGCRLFVDGKLVIDDWSSKKRELKRYKLKVQKDSVYNLTIEYWQGDGSAYLKFNIGNYLQTDFNEMVRKHKDAEVFIFAGGISPQLEGESMRVDDPGFVGGDRTSILLPAVQTALMKALKATGKPVVFVMMTGSAIATPWESENIPAILNAWYGGQAAGEAIADILFGDYNPSGKLPVTFYKSDADLASFTDYKMDNRTYRYFTGKPLYGFGYGLSYTSFKYDALKLPLQLKKGKGLEVSVRITNTGKLAGEEVVQLYMANKNNRVKMPLKALKGFERISLNPGESRQLKFKLLPEALTYVTAHGEIKPITGELQISIGGGQPDEPNQTTSNVVKGILRIN
ncbi:glycoside hydrolase family 3 C-terminal domain-containing protein [Pedobacter sp. ASV28]|uniref:glycoside hydrolase family 3 C-terminal domain-containing protein n=1 Tax=Pedobacter sp. ASV28 TaxID=2795123 RepID=UPI0018ECE603|nr:glycoside hydrolase family 3 C-terminal domain-containing protein [Pedobacter sp. ASV28]